MAWGQQQSGPEHHFGNADCYAVHCPGGNSLTRLVLMTLLRLNKAECKCVQRFFGAYCQRENWEYLGTQGVCVLKVSVAGSLRADVSL